MSGTITDLSKKAFEDALKRFQEEGDAFINHSFGFFDFRAGGDVNVGCCHVSDEITALSDTRTGPLLRFPENILNCLVFGPRHYALAISDEDSNIYILLRDSTTEKQWWVEGDMKRKVFRLVEYEQIPEFVRKAIDCELAKRAWSQLITRMRMNDAEKT